MTPEARVSFAATGELYSLEAELRELSASLETLFDDPGLVTLRVSTARHPALEVWDLLESLVHEGSIPYDDELSVAQRVASLTLDKATWADSFSGTLAGLASIEPEALRQLRSRIRDAGQYPDALAELHVWGFLAQRGLDVKLQQVEGKTDLIIVGDVPEAVEVKRIRYGSNPSRVGKVISKANKQIKATTSDRSGVLYVIVERSGERASLDDAVPSDVEPFLRAAASCLAGNNFKSISQVVMAWDEVELEGSLSEGVGLHTFLRKSKVLDHASPRTRGSFTALNADLRSSITRHVKYELPAGTLNLPGAMSAGLTFSDEFRNVNEFAEGVRAQHIRDAIEQPTARRRLNSHGVRLHLVTRLVVSPSGRYVLLVVGTGLADDQDRVVVHGAYKLFGTGDQAHLRTLAQEPLAAFLYLLGEFGHDVMAGQIRGRLIPHARVATGEGLIALPSDVRPQQTVVHGWFMFKELEGQRYTDACWIFGVDGGRYVTDVQRRRKLARRREAERTRPRGQRVQPKSHRRRGKRSS